MVTSHLDMLNGQLLDTLISYIVIQSYAAKQRYLGLSRSMEGKGKIKTIGRIKSLLEVKVCLTSGPKGPNKTMILVNNQ